MLKSAKDNMQLQARRNKVRFDKTRSDDKVQDGCKVLLKSHASNLRKKFSAKLSPKWRRPYIDIQQSSSVTFVLEDIETKEKRIAHAEQLRLVE